MDKAALLKTRIERFARERRWGRYHTPKNLAMAMVKEAAEVVEIFQWKTPAEAKALSAAERAHLGEELADTFVYLTKLADSYGIDLTDAALAKMDKNEKKYPAARGGRVASIRKKRR